jgi:hypothetical protein
MTVGYIAHPNDDSQCAAANGAAASDRFFNNGISKVATTKQITTARNESAYATSALHASRNPNVSDVG